MQMYTYTNDTDELIYKVPDINSELNSKEN